MSIFSRRSSESEETQPERYHAQEGSPEILQLQARVGNHLQRAFGDKPLDDPESFPHRIMTDTFLDLASVMSGKARAATSSAMFRADDPATDAIVDGLAEAFGVELPSSGVAGLRSVLGGLRELGQSRTAVLPAVKHANEKRFSDMDIIENATEPTILEHDASGTEKLILPARNEDNVKLVFSALGLNHPGSHEDEPLRIEFVMHAGPRPSEAFSDSRD